MNKQIALFTKQENYENTKICYFINSGHTGIYSSYVNSNIGKNYRGTEKGAAAHKKANKKYGQSKKGKFSQNKYCKKLNNDLAVLKTNGCAICGYNKCNAALEFHHINPKDKKFQLGAMKMHKSTNEILDEFNKCVLLCANCHREIEYINNYGGE